MTMTRLSHASSTHDGQPADHSCAPLLSAFESVLHDLRTPLTAIQAQTQLLQRLRAGSGDDTSRLRVGLLRIEDASRRLERLIEQLADDLHSGAEDRQAIALQPTDLVELTRRIGAESMRNLGSPNRVAVSSSSRAVVGRWDPARLERLTANLIDNALKYSPDDKTVVVKINRRGGQAALTVSDQGVGIPADEIPLVFNRFYRASNVIERFPGTGLGLAGVHDIVEQHGGRMSVTSAIGVGTTISVRLPLRSRALA
jgi:two-component system, OmpR family, phosphate regulon sensor histidine kinase PhoR